MDVAVAYGEVDQAEGGVAGADSAKFSLPEGTVVRAADGAADVAVAVADGVVDQAEGGAVGADPASLAEGTRRPG